MSRKRFTALIAATSILAGCATSPTTTCPSAQLGTAAPDYPVGNLEDGVEVIEAVPAAGLSTTDPIPFNASNPCACVPADVVTPLAHLARLRIDDHYAIECILQFDKAKSCWLTLDVSSPPPCTRSCTPLAPQPATQSSPIPTRR